MAPSSQGLYNPAFEHDACGVAMVVDMHGRRSRDIVDKAITALVNLEHRGAAGRRAAHAATARASCSRSPTSSCAPSSSSTCPSRAATPPASPSCRSRRKDAATACEAVEKIVEAEGLQVLGWRDVPTDDSSLGALARDAMPTFRQVFIARRLRDGPGAQGLRGAQARRARTRHQGSRPGRPRPRNRLFPKPFRSDLRLQGHADHAAAQGVLPRPAGRPARPARSASCTRGSPPTRSRRGRWPTRSGGSRTTARSTPSPATRTGCGRARR